MYLKTGRRDGARCSPTLPEAIANTLQIAEMCGGQASS